MVELHCKTLEGEIRQNILENEGKLGQDINYG